MLRLHDAAYNSMAKLPKIHGGDAACRKPVQSLPSPRSAALFAARLRRARSETPGWRILCSSPASFAGRLDLISDGKGNSAVRLEAGIDFGTDVYPGLHRRAILNRAAKGAALLRTMLSSQELFDRPAACCKFVQISWRVSWFPQVLKGHGFSEA